MFTKKTFADIKKSTLKIQDCKKDSIARLKHLKTILEFVDADGAKSLFETNYSHVYFILYDTFAQAESNLKHKDLPFQIAHKAHREELDGLLWLLKKILCLLPELLSRRWQCHSLSRIMAKLLHLGNSPWLRREGVRYFILWYKVLGENAPSYVHEMFADLSPGLIIPQRSLLDIPDTEFDTSDVLSHPNMKVEVGTSVFHDMKLHPVQGSELGALFPLSSNEKAGPLDPKEGLEIFLNCMVQTTGSIKWRDNSTQKDCKSFVFLLNRFKEVFLPVFCPDFDFSNSIYEPKLVLPQMRTINKKDEAMSSCVVVLINWIARFVHEKTYDNKTENIYMQHTDMVTIMDQRSLTYLQDKIVRDALYSTRNNINFIHEVFRQGFLLNFTKKAQTEAMRISVGVYGNWITSKNPPPFMLESKETNPDNISSSSIDSSIQGQQVESNSYNSVCSLETNNSIQAGLQNIIQLFVTNAANVFLVNTSNLNASSSSSSHNEFHPLNEQTDICKKVLNVYRTMVMNTRMEPKTWEQLLLVLLQITSIVLNQTPVGSKPALGCRLSQALFQTLIVTWIRAHTNVPINVQLWERFLSVLTSLTSKDALINEWEKTMQTLTRVLGRYVYNLNLQDLPLDRLANSKSKRRRIASVWQSALKERTSRSSQVLNDRNVENVKELQTKDDKSNLEFANRTVRTSITLGRSYSEGNLLTSRKTEMAVQHKKPFILSKPLSFDHGLNVLLDQSNVNSSLGKIDFRIEDSLFKGQLKRRAISLNSFHLKKSFSSKKRNGDSLQESRSPSPSASSGIEGGSIKDSPIQIDALVSDAGAFEDNVSMTSSEHRSIILGGYVSGWLPVTAAIMWKRMLGSLGDVNHISRPENHARVFKYLVEMTRNLIKIMENQGVSEDNLSTPNPPSLVPPISILIPWCYGAHILGSEFKKGQLSATKILCMEAIHGSVRSKKQISLFYNLLHKVFNSDDRQMIACIFKYLEGTRFLSLLYPGHTLLVLDIVHASTMLLTLYDPIRGSPHSEVIALLGSLLCYPSLAIPKLVLEPSLHKIDCMECSDLHDHILNIILLCARREPTSKGRCIAFAQLGQWIYLELKRQNTLKNNVKHSQSHNARGSVEFQQHSKVSSLRIKEAIRVLLQALYFKHRTLAIVAAGSLKICGEQSLQLSSVDNLPQLIITALCEALEDQHVYSSQDRDKVALSTFMIALGEFCMSFPVLIVLNSINKEGDSLIVLVLRVLFHILSGIRANNYKPFVCDADFVENISIDDVPSNQLSNESNYQKSKLSTGLCAKSVILHLVTYLGLFPPVIGPSRLSSLVEEEDDIHYNVLQKQQTNTNAKDSANVMISQNHQIQNIRVFILNAGLIASFIELPYNKSPSAIVSSGLVTAEKQVRVLLRDLNGKSCWEASVLYSEPRKLERNLSCFQSNEDVSDNKEDDNKLFYAMKPDDKEYTPVSRHTIRSRSTNQLPNASDMASDLDQLGDLLQYVGYMSRECLINSFTPINTPSASLLGCHFEAQTISKIFDQRSYEQKYEANLQHIENEKEFNLSEHSNDAFEFCNNNKSMYKPKYPFQLCRSLFSQLGFVGWERRSRTHLLQRSEKLKRELRNVDMQKCRDTHKVAIVYVASGQEDKNSILKNTYGSSAYESFVSALGWEIDLETHNGFLGGLPRQGCGASAPYYASPFVEVIFHAATRMPSDSPEALLTKTRHLGNDEVHIVWSEHHREYRRDILPTEFCDVLIVVYPLKNCLFRVTVNWKPDVPWFGPLASESIVNGSCLAILVRETAINASRSKRSSLSLYQQYYEERNRSLENVSAMYKENSTFEEFVNKLYSTSPATSIGETSLGSDHFGSSIMDKNRIKGWMQTMVDTAHKDSTHFMQSDEFSQRDGRKVFQTKAAFKDYPVHQGNTPTESPT